jgi:AcrR family transcriptional regulator
MSVTRTRLTRGEQQQQTRSRLVDSAAQVFARQGFARGSLEEIAENAGYSKGAIYSNFASKDELFLAVLEARFNHWLEAITDALDAEETPSSGLDALAHVCAAAGADRDWCLLFMEFWLHAARDASLRSEVAARYDTVRRRIAGLIERKATEFELDLPAPPGELAAAALALADGLALQRIGAPCTTEGNAIYAATLARIFGLEQHAKEGQA